MSEKAEFIDSRDAQFIEKRRWFVRRWNVVGGVLLAGMFGLAAWMYRFQPRLINPLHVLNEVEAGAISQSTLELMAVLSPALVSTIFVLLGVVILFGFAVFTNERRYLKIIERLQAKEADEQHSDQRARRE